MSAMRDTLLQAIETDAAAAGEIWQIGYVSGPRIPGRLERYTLRSDEPDQLAEYLDVDTRTTAGTPPVSHPERNALGFDPGEWRYASFVPDLKHLEQDLLYIQLVADADLNQLMYWLAWYNSPLLAWYRSVRWNRNQPASAGDVSEERLRALPVKFPENRERMIHAGKHVIAGLHWAYQAKGLATRHQTGDPEYSRAVTYSRRILRAAERVVEQETYGLSSDAIAFLLDWAEENHGDVPGVQWGIDAG